MYTDQTNNISIYNSIINILEGNQNDNKLLIKNCILFNINNPGVATYKDNVILESYAYMSDTFKASFFEKNIFRGGDALKYVNDSNTKDNWTGKNDIAIFGEEIGNEYDPSKTSNPQIISKEIDVKSTLDGKLKVSIKVEAQK